MRSPTKTHSRAKALRKTMSPPEVMLWLRLRARQPDGPRIRRQHPIGPYIADFYCAEARLVIEVDGWGHNMGDAPEHDARRDAYMAGKGLAVMRYTAAEVFADPDEVATGIWERAMGLIRQRNGLDAPSVTSPTGDAPPPPLRGGGEAV
jgi:very-short-patch-repair endonuclease